MSKTYDRIEWCFISKMIRRLGFPDDIIFLVTDFISTVTYKPLINREPTSVIIPQRGLRQGDPLSPYLFIICVEGLSKVLNKVVSDGYISSAVVSYGGPCVSHLLFADDSLLFCAADKSESECILKILNNYEAVSGQCVNLDKMGLFSPLILSRLSRIISKAALE